MTGVAAVPAPASPGRTVIAPGRRGIAAHRRPNAPRAGLPGR